MAIAQGSYELEPDDASLTVKTYREGVAAKAGHDLVIEVTRWGGTIVVGEASTPSRLELSADPRSLQVREGLRGIKSLTDKDRDEIRKNIDQKVLGDKPISFRSTVVDAAAGGRSSVRGELTMAGTTHETSFEVSVGQDGHVTGDAQLTQSEWGIKPYRGLMGALKVRDSLEIVFDGRLPAA